MEAVPCDNPHPGLRLRTMLRIASARPTLPTRGRDRNFVTFQIAKAAKACFNFVLCDYPTPHAGRGDALQRSSPPTPGNVLLELIVISTLNGVLFGMLLFLMASGLTVIFSMLGVLNFAHASFYMLGAFFG